MSIVGPVFAAAGYMWTGKLDEHKMAGPTAKWAIPDLEQIFEVIWVLIAALITYWLLLNGPSVEDSDMTGVNSLANSLRNFRREEGTVPTDLTPTSTTWFMIGAILCTPFFFSFGSMIGRELLSRATKRNGEDRDGLDTVTLDNLEGLED